MTQIHFRTFLLSTLLSASPMFTSSTVMAQPDGATATKPSPQHPAKFLGAASCASSNCHGGAAPRKSSNVLQNEYTTWYKHDAHAQAYAVLANEDSKRIALHLGIKDPQTAKVCLDCHSTHVPENLRGERFRIEDGVSCESCHGAGEFYIQTHTARDVTHAANIQQGMLDTVSLPDRAKVCMDCHYGTDDKTVDHRLIGAGHPRLTFELDTYSLLQPNHWEVDSDYVSRKGPYNSAQAWFLGQVSRAIEMTKAMGSKTRSHFGVYPELSLLYCYNCHHSLKDDQWKARTYGGRPGELQLNVSSILLVREGLRVLDPELGTRLEQQIRTLEGALVQGGLDAAAKKTETLLYEKILLRAATASYSPETLQKLLKQVASFAAHTPYPGYEIAEQSAMAISAIAAAIDPSGERYQKRIDAMYATLKEEETFEPKGFTAASQALLRAL